MKYPVRGARGVRPFFDILWRPPYPCPPEIEFEGWHPDTPDTWQLCMETIGQRLAFGRVATLPPGRGRHGTHTTASPCRRILCIVTQTAAAQNFPSRTCFEVSFGMRLRNVLAAYGYEIS